MFLSDGEVGEGMKEDRRRTGGIQKIISTGLNVPQSGRGEGERDMEERIL